MKCSSVEIEDAIYVHITGREEVSSDGLSRFAVADDDLLGDFLQFLINHPEIYQVGGGSTGLGNFSGTFPAEHRPAIEAFFQERGYFS